MALTRQTLQKHPIPLRGCVPLPNRDGCDGQVAFGRRFDHVRVVGAVGEGLQDAGAHAAVVLLWVGFVELVDVLPRGGWRKCGDEDVGDGVCVCCCGVAEGGLLLVLGYVEGVLLLGWG